MHLVYVVARVPCSLLHLVISVPHYLLTLLITVLSPESDADPLADWPMMNYIKSTF